MSRLLALTIALVLTACASVPPSPPPPDKTPEELAQAWRHHYQAVAGHVDWSLTGRIVVNTQDDGWNGELHWSQRSDQFLIQFNAPFGQGAFQLDGGARGVEMRFSDGQFFQAPDAESLLLQHLGWHLPLSGFRYWVAGVPEPQKDSQLKYNQDGRLASLKQDQWQVSYPDYIPVGDMQMPRKVYLENHELKVRLVIDRWELGAETEKQQQDVR